MLKSKLTYSKRLEFCRSEVSRRLCEIIAQKESNLAVAADVVNTAQLLQLADQLGPFICILKTHIDILVDFNPNVLTQLKALAEQHQFLLCEDRKFSDIGNTVQQQYQKGLYRIIDWADLVTVHTIAGPGTLSGLTHALPPELSTHRGILMVIQMSSEGQLADSRYTEASLKMVQEYETFVTGFIAQQEPFADPGYFTLTPGIQLNQRSKEGLGQRYQDPVHAIQKNRSDIVIVGRGILHAKDPVAMAMHYQKLAWSAYQACCV